MLVEKMTSKLFSVLQKPDHGESKSEQNRFPYVQPYNILDHQFDFWIVNQIAKDWYAPEDRDRVAEIIALTKVVQPGDRVLEIGSHHGFHTMLLSSVVGSQGFVLSLEANPFNAQVAMSQVALNQKGNLCQIKNLAASDTPGRLNFSQESNASVINQDEEQNHSVSVEATTGDLLAQKYGNFNVLKIDVEGFEAQVLRGCKQILKSKPKLALELHVPLLAKYHSTVAEIWELIGIDDYEGVMINRSHKYESHPFIAQEIPEDVVNLILYPRSLSK